MSGPIRVTTHEYSYWSVLEDCEILRVSYFYRGDEYYALLPADESARSQRKLRERFLPLS